jgi:RES domain-containing protein
LEVLVHLEDPEVFGKLFSWLSLEIPPETIETLEPETLPAGWNDDESSRISRAIGDAWLRSSRSASLAVPSVVTPVEWNYLLNPAHPDFTKILIGAAQPFRPDPRLLR